MRKKHFLYILSAPTIILPLFLSSCTTDFNAIKNIKTGEENKDKKTQKNLDNQSSHLDKKKSSQNSDDLKQTNKVSKKDETKKETKEAKNNTNNQQINKKVEQDPSKENIHKNIDNKEENKNVDNNLSTKTNEVKQKKPNESQQPEKVNTQSDIQENKTSDSQQPSQQTEHVNSSSQTKTNVTETENVDNTKTQQPEEVQTNQNENNIQQDNQTLSNQENTHQETVFSDVNYESKITELKRLNQQYTVDNIQLVDNLDNNNYLLFHFDNLGAYNQKNTLSFNLNSENYNVDYDGNSKNVLVKIKTNTVSNISNIKLNNQNISYSKSINTLARSTNVNNNLWVNSVSYDKNNQNITLYLNNNFNADMNSKVLVELKPSENIYGSDLVLEGNYENNHIVLKNVNNLDKSIKDWVVTNVFDLSARKSLSLPKDKTYTSISSSYKAYNPTDIKFSSENQFLGNINELKIVKDNSKYNTYNGHIELDSTALENLDMLKQKYIKINFVDAKQLEYDTTQPYSQSDINTYGQFFNGLDFKLRKDRIKNIKSIVLTYDQLNNFKISNLPALITWKFKSVELVNKYNFQPEKELEVKNKNQIQDIKFELSTQNTKSHGYKDNNYSLNKLNYENKDKTYYMDEISQTDNINWEYNDENWIKANDYYLYQTQYYYAKDKLTNKSFTRKFPNIEFNNHKKYNFATLSQHFQDKELKLNDTKNIYTYEFDLNNLQNIENKNAIISFNFFANPLNIEPSEWINYQNSYKVSFSYDRLVSTKHFNDLKIELIRNWQEIYKYFGVLIDYKGALNSTLNNEDIEKLVNENLSLDAEIKDHKLIIKIKAKNGILNSKIYLHDISQQLSTYVEKYQNYLSIMYEEDENSSNKLTFNPNAKYPNQLKLPAFIYSKNDNWKIVYDNTYNSVNKDDGTDNSISYRPQFEFSTIKAKTTGPFDNQIFDDVLKREISLDFGTGWMIAKVKPDDDNDNRYYVATNQHVPVNYSQNISAPKEHQNTNDTDFYLNTNYWSIRGDIFWEADDNREILGNKVTSGNPNNTITPITYSGLDWKIHIFDISDLLNYYDQNKSNSNRENDPRFKSAEQVHSWKTLRHIKFSDKGNYIKNNTFITTYLSTFPGHFPSHKRNVQIRNNFIVTYSLDSDPGEQHHTKSEAFGFQQIFKDISANAYNFLQGGSSGTGIFDYEGNFLAIHAGKDDGYNIGFILNSPRVNFAGEINTFNTNSFAYKVQRLNRLYPKNIGLPDVFTTFEKPFK
ncbi:hypothetical protein [Mycoplasma miroungirhinis]|uniref:DUF31 domain-containing protein n=1 Tax=Mycoplasma miroungirhinis TaxID=754516 RepID=A0A6M4JDC3_9MOLU|nr:hypothetical protein [Mycoplasma miroungirhinis]QJR44056.1 hypothetical protein HLA92_01215 [Mycoplasma miroungirhinis]